MVSAAAEQKILAEEYEQKKRKAAELSRAIAAAGKEIGGIPRVFNPERREQCERNLRFFLEQYTPEAVRLGWSSDHLELLKYLQETLLYGGQLAVGMPRGTGKSTIVSLAILWAILYGHHRFIVLIAATDPKAKKLLLGIKKQVEINQRILEDFPEVAYPVRCLGGVTNRQAGQTCGGEPTLISWGKEEVVFPTVKGSQASGAIVIVGGITGAVTRGPQHTLDTGEIIRPTVALLDDFQTRESARSPQQVQDRLDIIEADIAGMSGPDQSMSLLATVTVIYPNDGADQILNIDKHPEWGGIRKKFVLSMPPKKAMRLWEQYAEHYRSSKRTYRDARTATEFYSQHQSEMDEGWDVSWDKRFTKQTKVVEGEEIEVGEISAKQNAMNWFLMKPDAFASELQNEPSSTEQNSRGWKNAKQIEETVNALDRGIVPELLQQTEKLVAHVDVHDDIQYFTVIAVGSQGESSVIDYGTYPEQRRKYFSKRAKGLRTIKQKHPGIGTDGAVRASLVAILKSLLEQAYKGESGNEFQISKIGIDNGHSKHVVNSVVMELDKEPAFRNRVIQTKGFGVRAQDTPIAERKHKAGTRQGNHCYRPPLSNRNTQAAELYVDTNYWKTQALDRWATPVGEPGALSLFGYEPGSRRQKADHQGYSEHQRSEAATEVAAKGRTVFEFKNPPGRDNHWGDTLVNALAVASFEGCDVPANARPEPKRQRRKRPVSYL